MSKKIKKTIAAVAAASASATAVAGAVLNIAADIKTPEEMEREAAAAAASGDPVSVTDYTIGGQTYQGYGGWSPVTDSNGNLLYWTQDDGSSSSSETGTSTTTTPQQDAELPDAVTPNFVVTPKSATISAGSTQQLTVNKNEVASEVVQINTVSVTPGSQNSVGGATTSTSFRVTATAPGTVTYTSSDDSIATVDSNGKITAKSPGTVTITATSTGNAINADVYTKVITSGVTTSALSKTSNNTLPAEQFKLTQTVNITVTKPNIVDVNSGFEISPTSASLAVGDTQQISVTKNAIPTEKVVEVSVNVTGSDPNATETSPNGTPTVHVTAVEAGNVTYTSADPSIATVDSNGKITAVKAGTTKIRVTSTATKNLSTTTYKSTSVSANTGSAGGDYTNSSFETSSSTSAPESMTKEVTVTVSGVSVTGVSLDTDSVNLTGEISSVKASGTGSLTVGESGTSTGSGVAAYGQTAKLAATVAPENTPQGVTWASSDKNIASVSTDGTVKAFKPGTVTVTATSTADTTKKATANVTVTAPDTSVTWSSSDPSVVSVDASSGKTTAKAAGTATITATSTADSTKTASYTVTVAAKSDDTVYPKSISLDSDNYEVEVGGTKQAFVTFDPANTTDKSVTWEITSGSEFASVDADGLIHGLKKGEATLKATAVSKDADGKEVSATAKVTVTDPDEGRYTVTFVTDHATAPDAVRVNAGEKVTNPGNLAEEGFIFLGWYTDSNHTTAVDWDAPINENKTYYAGWDRETPERITIVFDGNGGTIGGQSTTSEDVEIVDGNATITGLAPAAERDGYTLTGWNSSADGTGVNIGDVIANAQDKATYTF